ncbi:3680_t:CDS:2 [Gigaspora rosea]|nr:3680_t:CDS:2 [Gigaspora rosea]
MTNNTNMNVLGIANLQWNPYLPPWTIASQGYIVVLLNSIILYIGGSTKEHAWGSVTPSGQAPAGRCGHSTIRNLVCNLPCTFTWSTLIVSNDHYPKKIMRWYSSTLIGAYVLIPFGYTYKLVSSYDPSTVIKALPTSTYGYLQCFLPPGIVAGLITGTFVGTLAIVGVSY